MVGRVKCKCEVKLKKKRLLVKSKFHQNISGAGVASISKLVYENLHVVIKKKNQGMCHVPYKADGSTSSSIWEEEDAAAASFLK